VKEDIRSRVGVAGNQVRRERGEGDEAAVRANRRVLADSVGLGPVAVDADAARLAALPVPDKDVSGVIGVARDEVRGDRVERNVAAVRADRGVRTGAVGLGSGGANADRAGRAGLTVMDEDIPRGVGVPRDQRGARLEGDVAAVGADGGLSCR
jgi:hypothetical protein